MKDIAGFITGVFSGLDIRRRWVAGGLCVLILLVSLWIYESYTGHFFYQTIEKRVVLLDKLYSLEDGGLDTNSTLYPIFHSTVKQLTKHNDFNIQFPSLAKIDPLRLFKAISASSIWILILIVGVTSEIRKDKKFTGTTIGVGLVLGFIVYVVGWLGSIIPTLGNPWVNYLAIPIAQVILMSLLMRMGKK